MFDAGPWSSFMQLYSNILFFTSTCYDYIWHLTSWWLTCRDLIIWYLIAGMQLCIVIRKSNSLGNFKGDTKSEKNQNHKEIPANQKELSFILEGIISYSDFWHFIHWNEIVKSETMSIVEGERLFISTLLLPWKTYGWSNSGALP